MRHCFVRIGAHQGVAPWQRSTRAAKRNRRAREFRLEYCDFDCHQTARTRCSGRLFFLLTQAILRASHSRSWDKAPYELTSRVTPRENLLRPEADYCLTKLVRT